MQKNKYFVYCTTENKLLSEFSKKKDAIEFRDMHRQSTGDIVGVYRLNKDVDLASIDASHIEKKQVVVVV